MKAASDRGEGRTVRRGCFAVVFVVNSPDILRTRERGKPLAVGAKFDFIYCAGLFDYLSGVTSKTIVNHFLSGGHRAASCRRRI